MKPEVHSEHYLFTLEHGVIVRAHTPSGVWVEKLDKFAKPTSLLFHIRDNAFWEMTKVCSSSG